MKRRLLLSAIAFAALSATATAADDAAIMLPTDPPSVQQARRDLLMDIRHRYGAYSGADCGSFVDMFIRNDPTWDRKANESIVKWIKSAQQTREREVWSKGKAWDGQYYPMEQQLLEVYYRYSDRVSGEAKKAIEEVWKEALFTDLDARRLGPRYRQSGSWYWVQLRNSVGSNWGLIAAEVAILGGQIANRPDFVSAGKKALQEWFVNTSKSGMMSLECNPMEGHWRIYSFTTAPIADWAHDPATRRLARLLLERVWLEKLIYFHPGTLRECGASGRCVVRGFSEPIVETNQRMWLGTQLNQLIPYTPPPPSVATELRDSTIHQCEPFLVSHWRIPDYLQDIAFRKKLPQIVRSSCDTETTPWPNAIPSKSKAVYPNPNRERSQSINLYTYLTETFAFGTASRGWADVGMPAMAFWKAHSEPPRNVGDHRALYVRYQHNDNKPFGQSVSFIRGKEIKTPPHQSWSECGRHAAMQDHGRAIVIYRPRLDYLKSYGLVPGVPSYVSLDGDLGVTSMQALACLYREDVSPRGFYIGKKPVTAFPATVAAGQWVFVDDGETWVAVRALQTTNLGGAEAARLVAGDRHVFLQADNFRSETPQNLDLAKLMSCRSGFLVAVGDHNNYKDFAAFRAEISASKISERCEGAEHHVEWTAGGKTLRLGWDVFEEQYLERSVNGATQDAWPKFDCPEYKQALTLASLSDATARTKSNPQTPIWLLAAPAAQTYVAYQPNPESAEPLKIETPLGQLTASNFPFGKVVLSKSRSGGVETVHLEIDAEYPAEQKVDFSLELLNANRPVTATINGKPALTSEKDAKGRWLISAYPKP